MTFLRVLGLLLLILPVDTGENRPAEDYGPLKDLVSMGFTSIYNFNFTRADSIQKCLSKSYSSNPWAYLYGVNYYWWLLLSEKETSKFKDLFYSCLDSASHKLSLYGKTMRQDDFDLVYSYIYLYAFKARIDILDGKYLHAVIHANDCINYLEKSFGKEEKYPAFNLTSGLYKYGIGYSVKNYPWLFPALLFVPKGDMEMGKKFLEIASQNRDVIVSTEGNYFMMKIFYEFEPDLVRAEKYANYLSTTYPDNLIYRYYNIIILKDLKKTSQVTQEMQKYIRSVKENSTLTTNQKKYYLELLGRVYKKK